MYPCPRRHPSTCVPAASQSWRHVSPPPVCEMRCRHQSQESAPHTPRMASQGCSTAIPKDSHPGRHSGMELKELRVQGNHGGL